MTARYQGGVYPEKEKKAVEQAATVKGDDCRCKEASEMTPRELLKLMFSDLSFWEKEKKG